MDWILDINKEYYDKVLKAGKEIEARVPDLNVPRKHYHKIKKDDILILRLVDKNLNPVNSVAPLKFKVTFNKKYNTFEKLLESEGLKKVMPKSNSIEESAQQFYSLPGYRERAKKNGVYAIGLDKT